VRRPAFVAAFLTARIETGGMNVAGILPGFPAAGNMPAPWWSGRPARMFDGGQPARATVVRAFRPDQLLLAA